MSNNKEGVIRIVAAEMRRFMPNACGDWADRIDAALATNPSPDGKCDASPYHADILETIKNATEDWQRKGYTSGLAEVRDMANIGRALMEALPEGYSYNDCPSEIVADLINERDNALAANALIAVGEEDNPIDHARNVVLEFIECARLRGDNELPHPCDDAKMWTARMIDAWGELEALADEDSLAAFVRFIPSSAIIKEASG